MDRVKEEVPEAVHPKRRRLVKSPGIAFVPLEHENSWGESRCGSPNPVPRVVSSAHINALVAQYSQPSPSPTHVPSPFPAPPVLSAWLQGPWSLPTAPFLGHVSEDYGSCFVQPSAFPLGLPWAYNTAPAYMCATEGLPLYGLPNKTAPEVAPAAQVVAVAAPEVVAVSAGAEEAGTEGASEQDGCPSAEGVAGSFFDDLATMAAQADIESQEIDGGGMRKEEVMGLGLEGVGLCSNVDTRRAVQDWLRDSSLDCCVQMKVQEGEGNNEGSLPLWVLEELGETETSAVLVETEKGSSSRRLVRTLSCGSSTNDLSLLGGTAAQSDTSSRDVAKGQTPGEAVLGCVNTELATEVPSGGLYKMDVPEQSVDSCSDECTFEADSHTCNFALMHAGKKDIILSISVMEDLLEDTGTFAQKGFFSSSPVSSPNMFVPETNSLGWIPDPNLSV